MDANRVRSLEFLMIRREWPWRIRKIVEVLGLARYDQFRPSPAVCSPFYARPFASRCVAKLEKLPTVRLSHRDKYVDVEIRVTLCYHV